MKRFEYSNDCNSPVVPEEIKKILLYQFDISEEDIKVDEPYEVMGLDSIELVGLVFMAQKEYDIKIPDSAVENCKTLGDFINLVNKIKNEKV